MEKLFLVVDTEDGTDEVYALVGKPDGRTTDGEVELSDEVKFSRSVKETDLPEDASLSRRSTPFQSTTPNPTQLEAEIAYQTEGETLQIKLVNELDSSVEGLFEIPVTVPNTQ